MRNTLLLTTLIFVGFSSATLSAAERTEEYKKLGLQKINGRKLLEHAVRITSDDDDFSYVDIIRYSQTEDGRPQFVGVSTLQQISVKNAEEVGRGNFFYMPNYTTKERAPYGSGHYRDWGAVVVGTNDIEKSKDFRMSLLKVLLGDQAKRPRNLDYET